MRIRLLLAGCLVAVSGLLVPAAHADKTSPVTIDISDAAESGDLSIFKKDGIRFAEFLIVDGVEVPSGYGLIQGQGDTLLFVSLTLGRPLVATFTPPVTGITVSFALVGPDVVGTTGQYTLNAYSASGEIVGTTTMTVTQTGTGEPGDPFRTPVGFFEITVSDLSAKAKSFSMTGTAMFGVNWISYTYD